jgi:tetratricopeptide (TPR) repeat protein
MDDVPAIDGNQSIRTFTTAIAPGPGNPVSGRPVVNLSLAVDYALNHALGVDQRENPEGPHKTVVYRLFNLLFHLGTAAFLFGIIRRAARAGTIPDEWRAVADPLAYAAAALWLLHPIQSEVVDYVVQRTEGLASLFYVATLYASLRAWETARATTRLAWYAAAVAAAALAMGSKEIAISVPLAVILYDRAFRLPGWRAILHPGHGRGWFYLALCAATLGAFAFVAAGGRGDTAGFHTGLPWSDYLYSQCWAIAHYLRLAIMPIGLAVDYGTEPISGWRGVPGLLLLSGFAIATIAAWMRVPKWGWFAFAGTWFFMLLAPSSSFVPIRTEIAAERRIYLALAAMCVLAVIALESLRRRWRPALPQRSLFAGVGFAAVVLTAGTAVRNHTYSSSERLWRNTVAHVPENPRAYDNLGQALMHETPPNYPAADSAFRLAMSVDTTCHFGCANLARIMIARAQLDAAVELLDRALERDPGNAPAEQELVLAFMKKGEFERAIPILEDLAGRYPYEDHLIELGVAYLSARQVYNALNEFSTARRLYPYGALRQFGSTLDAAARSPEALPYLQELAITLAAKGQ